MKLVQKIFNFLMIGILILAAVYFAGEKGWLEKTPLKEFDHTQLNLLSQDATEQAQVLSSRVKETGEHAQQVLGQSIEADEESKQNKPLHERTIEYARYMYCKQVVNQWEEAKN